MSEHESPDQSRPAAKEIPEYITALKSILDAIEDEPDVFLDPFSYRRLSIRCEQLVLNGDGTYMRTRRHLRSSSTLDPRA